MSRRFIVGLPDAKAETVAKKLVEEFVCRFGVPHEFELHSDQGTNFESKLFAEMCRLLGIRKTRTTAHSPKSDGLVERFNRTLVNVVAILLEEDRGSREWDELLPYATSAYRSSPQESTGESPNMMMLGRETSLPVDLTMPEAPQDEPLGDFAEDLRMRIQQAHQRAEECFKKSAARQKRNYDRKVTNSDLQEGMFVWLYDHSRKKGISPKLQLRWKGPYLIVTKPVVVHSDRLKPYRGEEKEK